MSTINYFSLLSTSTSTPKTQNGKYHKNFLLPSLPFYFTFYYQPHHRATDFSHVLYKEQRQTTWGVLPLYHHVLQLNMTLQVSILSSCFINDTGYNTVLPYKKCDVDSHGNSMSFHIVTWHKSTAVCVWSKSTLNSMSIPRHFPRFYLFSMLKHDTTWILHFTQVQVMEFPRHFPRK